MTVNGYEWKCMKLKYTDGLFQINTI